MQVFNNINVNNGLDLFFDDYTDADKTEISKLYYGEYIKDDLSGTGPADTDYRLIRVYLHSGLYMVRGSNSHPLLVRSDSSFEGPYSLLLQATSKQDFIFRNYIIFLREGYYIMCWTVPIGAPSWYDTQVATLKRISRLNDLSCTGELFESNYERLFNPLDALKNKYIREDLVIYSADNTYRTILFTINKRGQYLICAKQPSEHPNMAKYKDPYGTVPEKMILPEASGGLSFINDVYILEPGYYAMTWVKNYDSDVIDDDEANVFLINEINDDNNKIISNDIYGFTVDVMNLLGSSTRSSDGTITLTSGIQNAAKFPTDFECAHWEQYVKFICTEGVSFIMGKDNSTYGGYLEITLNNNQSKFILYNTTYSQVISNNLPFSLVSGEEYILKINFNININKIISFELIGQYNEYFNYTFNDVEFHGYGSPFFYSNQNNTIVKQYYLSNKNYYNVKTPKVAVWGHSFVEGDSLGQDRNLSFTNLLANEIGQYDVMNFGLGGDVLTNLSERIKNEVKIAKNIDYAIICIGSNDSGRSADSMKPYFTSIDSTLKSYDIKPYFMTIPPNGFNGWNPNQNFIDINAWIRNNLSYIDIEQSFLNVNAQSSWTASNVKTDLFLGDLIHPNVDGHHAIFNRIKMDLPFIF